MALLKQIRRGNRLKTLPPQRVGLTHGYHKIHGATVKFLKLVIRPFLPTRETGY
jgi:hypothetical protein